MLKGIKQPNLGTQTTKLPGTELPTVRHSSDITGNKDVSNVVRNMTSSMKNPFMGQRAVMTNTKNHNMNQVKSSLPSIKTGFEPVKIHESIELRKALILETTTLRNVIDHGVQGGVKVHSGGKDLGSGTKKEQTKAINDPVASPKKPLKGATLGIQDMPQKKKNQGLSYLSKLDTQKRQQGIIQ